MPQFQTVRVGGLCEANYDLTTLATMQAEGLGDYTLLFVGPWRLEQIERVAAFCRAHGYRFVMDELINRLSGQLRHSYQDLDTAALAAILDRYRDCCDGSLFLCEYGGLMLYWPASTVQGSPLLLPPTEDHAEAAAAIVARLRALIADSQAVPVRGPLISVEAAGPVARWLYQGGIDRVDLEVTYDPQNELFLAAVKGATETYGKPAFGVDMAMVWYGGDAQHDALWFQRWRTSLDHAFLRGADPIYAEHGLMDFKALGKDLAADAPEVRRFRAELGDFARFVRAHPRPAGFPQARLAVVQGLLDGYAGVFQTHVWGQRDNDAMRLGEAEASWALFNTFYQRQPWEFRHACGAFDYSGNPPLGQVDVLPAEASLALFQRYDCVLFLGWNTMTPELYAKLTAYVHGGGHLLATLAHLDTATRRGQPPAPIHGGDLRELFGVTVDAGTPRRLRHGVKFCQDPPLGAYRFALRSLFCDPDYQDGGFPLAALTLAGAEVLAVGSDRVADTAWPEDEPVLTAHRHGRGLAMLVNALAYPGHPGLAPLYRDLLRAVATAWQPDLRVVCGDRVRFAVYAEDDRQVLYLLNTEPALPQHALISCGANQRIPVTLPPGALRAVTCTPDLMAIAGHAHDRVTDLRRAGTEVVCATLAPPLAPLTLYRDGHPVTAPVPHP